MAEDLINLTPGTSPPNPNIEALIDSGDPNTITDTDLANAPIGSLLIRRDGIPGGFLYKKTAASVWTANDRVYDVKVYGAIGDDTADDTNAIQNAINAAGIGGTVYVPPGTYLFTNTLLFESSYATLQLASGAKLDYNPPRATPPRPVNNAVAFENTHGGKQPVGCALRGESAGTSIITCVTEATGVIVCSNGVVTDVTVQGAGTGSGDNGITGGNTLEVTISRCVVTGFDNGINSGDTSARWTITNNVVELCNVDGIYMSTGTTDFVITGNIVSSIGRNGIDMNGGNHIVANNVVQNCGIDRKGTGSDWWGILLQPVAGSNVNGCVIIGNSVSSCIGPGITIQGWATGSPTGNNNVLIGNVVWECGGGIWLDGYTNTGQINENAVIGNVVEGTGLSGVYLNGSAISMQSTLVVHNLVTGNGGGAASNPGIHVSGDTGIVDTQIFDNVVVGNADNTAPNQIVASAPRSTVSGNKIETSDSNYVLSAASTSSATNIATVVVENTTGGATIFNIEGTGSQYQVNGTPI